MISISGPNVLNRNGYGGRWCGDDGDDDGSDADGNAMIGGEVAEVMVAVAVQR